MLNKKIILALFAFAFILAFSNVARAGVDAMNNGVNNNIVLGTNATVNGGIGGANTGSTVTLRLSLLSAQNFSLRAIYTNSSGAGTWAIATVTGVSGNTTCSSDSCNHSGAGRGAMAVTFTLPADANGVFIKAAMNNTAAGGYTNRTSKVKIDSTAPTFTLYPAEGFTQSNINKLVNITLVTNENVSSIWVYVSTIQRNFSNTLDTNGTYGLANSGDNTWKFATALSSNQLVSYYGKAYDYAVDSGNGAKSSVRTFQLHNGGSSAATLFAQEEAQKTQTTPIVVIVIIGLLAWAWFSKK